MTEEQIAAQLNGDENYCQECPHSTGTCRTEGCIIPGYDDESGEDLEE